MFKKDNSYRMRNGKTARVLAEVDGYLIGYFYDKDTTTPYACRWLANGKHDNTDEPMPYDLTEHIRAVLGNGGLGR
jgi:hypothetical protein